MNSSLQETLIELANHGQNRDVQRGIRLSISFLETVTDKEAGIEDLRRILLVLEKGAEIDR